MTGLNDEVEKKESSSENVDEQKKLSLIEQRTVLRSSLTKMTKSIDEDRKIVPDQDEFALKIHKLECKIKEYNQVASELLELGEQEDKAQISNAMDCVFKANRFLRRLEDAEAESSKRDKDDESSSSSEGKKASSGSAFKYKSADLPKFYGDHAKFPEWFSIWKIVDNEKETVLPKLRKYLMLTDLLRGSAATVLAGKHASPENYDKVMIELKEEYGDPLHQVSLFSTQMYDLEKSGAEAKQLRKMVSKFETCLRELQMLFDEVKDDGLESGPCDNCKDICTKMVKRIMNMFVAPLLLRKLPDEIVLLWKRECDLPKEIFRLDNLISFVKKEIRNLDTFDSKSNFSTVDKESKSNVSRRMGDSRQSGIGAIPKRSNVYGMHTRTDEIFAKCCFCGGNDHQAVWKCGTFMGLNDPNKRKEMAEEKRLCFVCLEKGHSSRFCTVKEKCCVCSGHHHSLLHGSEFKKAEKKSDVKKSQPPPKKETASGSTREQTTMNVQAEEATEEKALLMTAVVWAINPETGDQKKIKLLADSCSTRTYVRSELVDELNLPIEGSRTFRSLLFGERKTAPVDHAVVSLNLKGVQTQDEVKITALSCSKIAHPLKPTRVFSMPCDFVLADDGSEDIAQIDVLLGADCYWSVMLPQAPVLGNPTLVPSIFGYMTHGPVSRGSAIQEDNCQTSYYVAEEDELNSVENIWKLDAIGISHEDEDLWKPEIEKVNGRYQTKLPWINEERPQYNYGQAKRRLDIAVKNMKEDEKNEYSQYVKEMKDNGVIEKVENQDMKFILPHFAIRREGKGIRVVFDAKAGLNKYLGVGPNLLQELVVVVLQSRFWKFLGQGDVKAAFHQVVVHESDRNFLCLLWEDKCFRFCKLPFGLNCSPAILNASLALMREEFQERFPETTKKLDIGTYVDDVCSGGDTKSERNQFVCEAHFMFESSGFNLTKWKFSGDVDIGEDPVGTNLGMPWDRNRDVYWIDVGAAVPRGDNFDDKPLTRRMLVSSVAKVYDVLGISCPWTLRGRALIQESWKNGKSWDEPVDKNVQDDWKRWISEAREIPSVEFNRYVPIDQNSSLHFFSDASEKGYAALCYVLTNGEVFLIYGRSRVAPKKKRTIPELELLGTLLSVRLTKGIRDKIPVVQNLKVTFWTDSTIALQWIKNEDLRLKVFVRNRVMEIREVGGDWRHCPGEFNPADVASRGTSLKELMKHHLYWKGPSFLNNSAMWPPSFPCLTEEEEQMVMVSVEDEEKDDLNEEEEMTEPLFGLSETGMSLRKIANKTAYVMRFINNIRSPKESRISGPLTKEEIDPVRDFWIRRAQHESFAKEISALKKGNKVPKNSSLIALRPVWDEKRCLLMGQPRNGEPLLPIIHAGSSLSIPIFIEAHNDVYHGGAQATLMCVREKFHVVRGRVLAKAVVKGCRKCKRFRSVASGSNEGSLPSERVTPARPFSVVGIDFFGPLFIDGQKKWVLLFTCGIIRAIHLELVDSQGEEDVSLAMRRFVARRGTPKLLYSDNAKTYVKLAKSFPGKWKFIPEKAPWHGGFYERMVGVVKSLLKVVLHGISLPRIALETVLFEIEAAVNSRPLTSISSASEDPLPLSPNHFLYGVAPEQDSVLNSQHENFVPGKKWRLRLQVAQSFWDRFKKEYLSTLRTWRRKITGPYHMFNPGDVVLVQGNKMTPRSKWCLARIIELDNNVEGPFSAKILLGSGEITRRPMNHLYPIEENVGTESLKIDKLQLIETDTNIDDNEHDYDTVIENNTPNNVEIINDVEPIVSRVGRRIKRTRLSEYDYD